MLLFFNSSNIQLYRSMALVTAIFNGGAAKTGLRINHSGYQGTHRFQLFSIQLVSNHDEIP